MLSGPSALKNIDQTLHSVRNEVVRIDQQVANLTDNLASCQRRRVKILQDIAAVRLVEIEKGTLQDDLTSADRDAASSLQERDAALAHLNEQIEALNAQIDAAERARRDLLDQVNRVSAQVAETEANIQQQLKTNEAYLTQLEKARAAESVAEEAAIKVENAQKDMAEKAVPYDQDELFSYLWKRHYGTPDYKAGFFARFMDGWVARLIGYEPARINYWNLTEIPLRLQQHADRVASAADEELMALQQIELDALAAAGVAEMETQLTALRETIDQHDDALEAKEEELNSKLGERAKFIAGEDKYIQRCLAGLSKALEHSDLQAIHRYVQVTSSPTDDELVLELQLIDDRARMIEGDLADLRKSHFNQLHRLQEIEEVRRKFKNSRFDDVRSGFNDESLLAGVLSQFIQGLVSGSDLWRVLKRNQHYRDMGSVPDFGSGGLGNIGDILGGGQVKRGKRRQRDSSWNWPKPRRGGGGFNFPGSGRGAGNNGGGFKTGGGF